MQTKFKIKLRSYVEIFLKVVEDVVQAHFDLDFQNGVIFTVFWTPLNKNFIRELLSVPFFEKFVNENKVFGEVWWLSPGEEHSTKPKILVQRKL